MPGPGFEPGLLRPQRSVLTTRRSRLTIPPTGGWRQKICLLPYWYLFSRALNLAKKRTAYFAGLYFSDLGAKLFS